MLSRLCRTVCVERKRWGFTQLYNDINHSTHHKYNSIDINYNASYNIDNCCKHNNNCSSHYIHP